VTDPFMGSDTTLAVCKSAGIPSKGIDANDFMVDAARQTHVGC
jgi:DNA modification methylase